MLAKGAPRNAPSENTLPPLVSTKKHPWAQRGQTHRNTPKKEISRKQGLRVGGQGPPMSALRGAGLGVFVVVIWTKNLRKGVANVWGHKEAEKT